MNTYEISGESRFRVYRKFFYEAETAMEAIAKFKKDKGNYIKHIEAKLITKKDENNKGNDK